MKKFSYEEVAKEQGWNFEKISPKVEYLTDYDYYKTVVGAIGHETIMLDIGCGSGEKSLKFFSNAKKVVMLDLEPEMLKKVEENKIKMLTEKEQVKFETTLGNGDEKLDFDNSSFDLVVSRHCGANMSEVFRILRKGGVFISEDIDDGDCLELKEYFGRGQNYEKIKLNQSQKAEIFNKSINLGFENIELKQVDYIEYYPNKEQLKYLLTRTPILGYYDDKIDDEILDKYIEQNQTEKGIKLIRRLFAFYIVK